MTHYKPQANRIKKASGSLYAWFWYHTELWLSPPARRPYTFILRDVYHNSPLMVTILLGAAGYISGRWLILVTPRAFIIVLAVLLVGTVLGHLFWGGAWISGQQERPEYNPGKKQV